VTSQVEFGLIRRKLHSNSVVFRHGRHRRLAARWSLPDGHCLRISRRRPATQADVTAGASAHPSGRPFIHHFLVRRRPSAAACGDNKAKMTANRNENAADRANSHRRICKEVGLRRRASDPLRNLVRGSVEGCAKDPQTPLPKLQNKSCIRIYHLHSPTMVAEN